ncbi:MAG: sensor histidine kinase, partial [Gammaproteobacteria bacterium]
DQSAHGVFAKLQLIEFKRVISNLINNAYEATIAQGIVTITLKSNEKKVIITIKDNGCGISPERLPKLFQKGESTKNQGFGLGLYHAKQIIDSLDGSINIESIVGTGTIVTLELPIASTPVWFCNKIILPPRSKVLTLDDDESIRQVWDSRLLSLAKRHEIEVIHFNNVENLINWYCQHPQAKITCLFDYELIGQNLTGLDVISQLKIARDSFLVTSRYEDSEIRKRCAEIQLKIIPKSFSAFIPIEVETNNLDLIFVDNDSSLTAVWKMRARDAKLNIAVFNDPQSFMKNLNLYSKNIAIYLDSDLGAGARGEVLAKELYDQGFNNIYLTTGYDKEYFPPMPWIKDIIGKMAPF